MEARGEKINVSSCPNKEIAGLKKMMMIMKSTKVQNPRCIPRIKPKMRAYWPPIALQLFPGQYSLLRRLAASCIVWDKAEPPLFEQSSMMRETASSGVPRFRRSRTVDCRGVGSRNYTHAHYL